MMGNAQQILLDTQRGRHQPYQPPDLCAQNFVRACVAAAAVV